MAGALQTLVPQRLLTVRWWAGCLAAGALLSVLAAPARAQLPVCDRVAATTGSDSNPGTVGSPVRTPKRLIDSLSTGQTGCFRAGTYSQEAIDLKETSGTTITSYPGERATLVGGIVVTTDRVKIADLNLDGRNPLGLPSPIITGDDVVIQGNDITNGHTTGSCVHPTSFDGLFAERVVIVGNRIHDCGRLPATNLDHGIYYNATAGVIESNVIYDNADQGIVLWPVGRGTVIKNNTIDGNGEGILFAGDEWEHSDLNLASLNIVSNSRLRWNIETYWYGEAGTLNLAAGNCVWATNPNPVYNARGGVSDQRGLTAAANPVGDPRYANRAAKDFRLQPDSPCRGYGAAP